MLCISIVLAFYMRIVTPIYILYLLQSYSNITYYTYNKIMYISSNKTTRGKRSNTHSSELENLCLMK